MYLCLEFLFVFILYFGQKEEKSVSECGPECLLCISVCVCACEKNVNVDCSLVKRCERSFV